MHDIFGPESLLYNWIKFTCMPLVYTCTLNKIRMSTCCTRYYNDLILKSEMRSSTQSIDQTYTLKIISLIVNCLMRYFLGRVILVG